MHFSAVCVYNVDIMTVETVMKFMEDYGSFIIFALIFIEYLCIPGFPGGICIPAAGTISKMGNLDFFRAYFFGVIAAVLSQIVIYCISAVAHGLIYNVCQKYSLLKKAYDRADSFIQKYGISGLFIARLIPVARTFVSFPAGIARVSFSKYLLCSAVGTGVYVLVMISLGYFAAELFV